MFVRRARVDDAEGIAKVHVDSWRTTYRNIIPSDFLDRLSYEQRTNSWIHNIERVDNFVIVAENNEGNIIGFGDCGKRETNLIDQSGDLTSIYLLEEYQGRGIGKAIFKELLLHLKKLGYIKIFVEVLEENKTKYFYEYYGAKLIKTIPLIIGGRELNELIYEWDDIDSVLSKL